MQHAPGRKGARQHGDDHLADVELVGERRRLRRARSAIGDEGEIARIDAAANRYGADRIRHFGVDDVEDAFGHRLRREAEAFADRAHRRGRLVVIEAHRAAGEIGAVEAPEHEIGVADGRLDAAAPVARRTRD